MSSASIIYILCTYAVWLRSYWANKQNVQEGLMVSGHWPLTEMCNKYMKFNLCRKNKNEQISNAIYLTRRPYRGRSSLPARCTQTVPQGSSSDATESRTFLQTMKQNWSVVFFIVTFAMHSALKSGIH